MWGTTLTPDASEDCVLRLGEVRHLRVQEFRLKGCFRFNASLGAPEP